MHARRSLRDAIRLHQQIECEALDDELQCEERCEPVIRMFEDVLEVRILIEARRVEHLWGGKGAVLSSCMQGGRWEIRILIEARRVEHQRDGRGEDGEDDEALPVVVLGPCATEALELPAAARRLAATRPVL